MATQRKPHGEPTQAPIYEIRLQGHLGCEWQGWFDGMTVTRQEHGETWLVGPVADQAALHGVLRKVRDVGLPLLAVTCLAVPNSSSQGDQA
jgi:hypothetical protein